jgi:hypothetical protein
VTDRPDVTNSSLVVPRGSLQIENGVNASGEPRAVRLDSTNTRLRLGIGACTELLIDLPSWSGAVSGRGAAGFGDAAPAVKHQLDPLAGAIDLALAAGLGLPSGARRIAGPGPQPYLQLPWSHALGDGWSVSGMATSFFLPDQRRSDIVLENDLVLERELGPHADAFVELVGDYPRDRRPVQSLNGGAAWRLSATAQLDLHGGIGLDRDAPRWFVGIGYSVRFDGLF